LLNLNAKDRVLVVARLVQRVRSVLSTIVMLCTVADGGSEENVVQDDDDSRRMSTTVQSH